MSKQEELHELAEQFQLYVEESRKLDFNDPIYKSIWHPDGKIQVLYHQAYQLVREDISVLYSSFEAYAYNNNNIIKLVFLVEYIRSNGIFYHDYTTEQDNLLNHILQVAIDIANQPEALTNSSYMWFIKELCDTIFHQLHLEEFSDNCKTRYFELSRQLLNSKFITLSHEHLQHIGYYECLYFLSPEWFILYRRNEFWILLKQVKKLSKKNPFIEENWLLAYEKLETNNSDA